jgi:hypothetical protein
MLENELAKNNQRFLGGDKYEREKLKSFFIKTPVFIQLDFL